MNAPREHYNSVSKYKNCIFYDMGHGGVDPTTGKYMTPPINGKFFDHGSNGAFHKDGIFYEGEKNREYGYAVVKRLQEEGVNVVVVNHRYIDTPLIDRTNLANEYHKNIQPGFYFSEHSNAANTKARGISVWTSIGQTTSDKYASLYMNMMKSSIAELTSSSLPFSVPGSPATVKFMEQMTDGDSDYEQNFHVLVKTVMPAILCENLFFDNLEDAELLFNSNYKDWYVNTQVEFLLSVLKDMEQ